MELETRRLGRTDLRVSTLALGTVELGMDYGIRDPGHAGKPDPRDAVRLVHSALDAGINLLDTARAYGDSESILGRALHRRRDRVVIATKTSACDHGCANLDDRQIQQRMGDELNVSLRALQTDYVDVWQIHNVDEEVIQRRDAVAAAFDQARSSGKVRFVGGSFYGAELPRQALGLDLFDTMQVTYSVLDQRIADHFLSESEQRDVGVIARSVLLKGALTDRAEFLPDELEPLRARSREFRRLVADSNCGLDAPQAALAFALAQRRLGTVLVGVRSEAELRHNLLASDSVLPEPMMRQLTALRLDDPDLLNPATWGVP